MNKHIGLVKKWLEDPSSVTTAELRANADAAYATAAPAAAWAYAAACAAADAADDASAYAAADAANAAAYTEYTANCVKRYDELTEDKGNG